MPLTFGGNADGTGNWSIAVALVEGANTIDIVAKNVEGFGPAVTRNLTLNTAVPLVVLSNPQLIDNGDGTWNVDITFTTTNSVENIQPGDILFKDVAGVPVGTAPIPTVDAGSTGLIQFVFDDTLDWYITVAADSVFANTIGNAESNTIFLDYDLGTGGASTTISSLATANTRTAEENKTTGVVDTASSDLEFAYDVSFSDFQIVGINFPSLALPQGASITDAYIQFQVDEVTTGAVDLVVMGEATDDASAFAEINNDVSTRTKTTASVAWSPADWLSVGDRGVDQRTSNIAPVIQEIINRPGWQQSNNLNAFIDSANGTDTTVRTAESYGSADPSASPELFVTYQEGVPTLEASVIATVDTTRPGVTIFDSPVSSSGIYTLRFEFDEVVTGFDINDITATNSTLSNFTGSGATYHVDVTPSGIGNMAIDIPENGCQDSSENLNTAAAQVVVQYSAPATGTTRISNLLFADIRRTPVDTPITFGASGTDVATATAITVVSQPSNGVITVSGNDITFTPNPGVSSIASGTLQAEWSGGITDTASFKLHVETIGVETYYDPINGSDSNPGTEALPKKTGIEDAINNASSGDRIYLKGGQTYDINYILRNVAGSTNAPVVLGSYGGSKATLNASGSNSVITMYDNAGNFVLENINITGITTVDAVLVYNEGGSTDVMSITYDDVDISGGRNGINNQNNGTGSFNLIHSTLRDNDHLGWLGGNNQDVVMMQNTFIRNADHKNYDGGPMLWNTYITKTNSLLYEGNHSEESEGLMKLRATQNFTIQKNTFKAGWIIGVTMGSEHKNNETLDNGLFTKNLIEESQNSITLGDADNEAGGVINNLVIRDNAAVKGKDLGGFTRNSVLYAADEMTYNNVTIYNNIFWADGPGGQGGSRVDDYLEFYDNSIGGADFVTLQRFGAPPDTHGNQLYRIDAGASLGMELINGNIEIFTVPQEVTYILALN